jgi:hypothetical protein
MHTPAGSRFDDGGAVEHVRRAPGVSSPPPALFLLFFLASLFLVRPRRRLSPAPTAYCRRPARADAVKAGPLFSGHTLRGLRPLQQSSTTAGLMSRGRLRSCLFYPIFVSARVIPMADVFWQALLRSPWRVRRSHQLISGSSVPACQGAVCMDDRAGGMGLIFLTADLEPICEADQQSHIRPTRHSRLRVSELSAKSTLSCEPRPLGNETLLEITPQRNSELARHCNDHDALYARSAVWSTQTIGQSRSWVDV